MCRLTVCRTCGLSTWAGCGAHVAQVRALVPADQWCTGHPDAPARPGLLARLLGRTSGKGGESSTG